MEKLKLPNLDEIEAATDTEKVQDSLAKTQLVLNKLMQNMVAFQKIEENNKKLRFMLLKNQDIIKHEFSDKLNEIRKNFTQKQKTTETNHKELLKKHEVVKLEFNNKITKEKDKYKRLQHEYEKLGKTFKKLGEEYLIMKETNKKVMTKLAFLEQKSLANEKLLDERTEIIRNEFEKKVQNLIKNQMDREIEYRAKIDSLNDDLKKYYTALKVVKKKQHNREIEIKEKITELNKTLLNQ